jgi:hypothetical protein
VQPQVPLGLQQPNGPATLHPVQLSALHEPEGVVGVVGVDVVPPVLGTVNVPPVPVVGTISETQDSPDAT